MPRPAVVAHGAGDVRLEELPDVDLAPGQIRLGVVWGGVCGSDVHYVRHGAVGDFRIREPLVLGHEVSGVVLEVHRGVAGTAAVGDRVVVHPATVDGTCPRCLAGHPNQCTSARYLGSAASWPHTQGGFVTELVVRADQLVAVPDSLDLRTAALAEPLGVAVHALRRASNVLDSGASLSGTDVLVVGAGPIGALSTAAAVAAGARVTATDLSARALGVAAGVGAHHGIDVTGLDAQDAAAAVHDVAGPPDVVVESSGSPAGLAMALHAARRGGVVVLLGLLPPGSHPVPAGLAAVRELTLVGSFRFVDGIREAVDLLAGGLQVTPVITHELPVSDAVSAIALAADPSASTKVLLRLDGGLRGA